MFEGTRLGDDFGHISVQPQCIRPTPAAQQVGSGGPGWRQSGRCSRLWAFGVLRVGCRGQRALSCLCCPTNCCVVDQGVLGLANVERSVKVLPGVMTQYVHLRIRQQSVLVTTRQGHCQHIMVESKVLRLCWLMVYSCVHVATGFQQLGQSGSCLCCSRGDNVFGGLKCCGTCVGASAVWPAVNQSACVGRVMSHW